MADLGRSSPPPIGLYVHVPFCVSKCAYCDFASYAGRESDVARYVDAVVREIERRGAETGHPRADTIFFGGGTPSLLNAARIQRIIESLSAAFAIDSGAEVTCECNPGTLQRSQESGDRSQEAEVGRALLGPQASSLEPACECPHHRPLSRPERGDAAQGLRRAGVSRLSIGAQAAQDHLLRLIGRIHHWEDVVASVDAARQAGFENINLDLMLGLPAQSLADVRETLAAALALRPTHISCYGLIVEDGTPLARDIAAGKLAPPDETLDREMYELARQTLAAQGFEQYEISNFARAGYACRHNIGCWTRVPYLGFGCAAHSFYGECRTMNPPSLDAYLAGESPQVETISRDDARFESLMLGLRMTRGVSNDDFLRMHGLTIREAFGDKLAQPIAAGLIEWHQGRLRLTRRGMDVQNTVLVELM